MMDGVTVLNSYTENISGWGFSGAGLVFAIIAFIFLCATIGSAVDDDKIAATFLIGMILFTCLSLILFSTANPKALSYEVYQVTIDDSVSFTKFNEKYEILSQDGLIYTIKDQDE